MLWNGERLNANDPQEAGGGIMLSFLGIGTEIAASKMARKQAEYQRDMAVKNRKTWIASLPRIEGRTNIPCVKRQAG